MSSCSATGRSGPIGNRESVTAGAREVQVFPDLEALSEAAAEIVVGIARDSVEARGRFSIALAGGNTPRRTYQ